MQIGQNLNVRITCAHMSISIGRIITACNMLCLHEIFDHVVMHGGPFVLSLLIALRHDSMTFICRPNAHTGPMYKRANYGLIANCTILCVVHETSGLVYPECLIRRDLYSYDEHILGLSSMPLKT